jgi:steroid delta-isomerase-like uncharacterized protein
MSEENKALMRRAMEFSPGALSEDYVSHRLGHGDVVGLEALKKANEEFFAAFSDRESTIHEMIAEGDKIVDRSTMNATHTGTFRGIAPTGKRVSMSRIAIHRIADGKVVEGWILYDMFGLMQQIGAISAQEKSG